MIVVPANIPGNRRNKSHGPADLKVETRMGIRQSVLIDSNIRWLRQALSLLNRLDDVTYSTSPNGFAPHRAGGHLRHIVEFYQCFLKGVETLHIDYDARPRDESIEQSRAAASAAIRSIIRLLETSLLLRGEVI